MNRCSILKSIICTIFLIPWINNSWSQEDHSSYRAFNDQEEIVYRVYYNWRFVWIPAGEVKFRVKENDEYFEFVVEGRSYPSYDSFFKVRDDYVSRADKESLFPHNFRRNIEEGRYFVYDSLSFEEPGMIREYFGKTESTARLYEFELDLPVHDMVSAIYALRSLPLSDYNEGDKIPFRIFFDKELFELNLEFEGNETKKIRDIGQVKVWKARLDLIDGYVFKEGDIMNIWISRDENKIPLLIESPISFGSVKAVLISANGLSYPSEYNLE